ncbi:hypothetical protein Pcinc_022720 [Petrolisthes cinctipes]|uniref:Uncharacterized protein n=1 Tax=Petrolisthes cinctipes TaxID=88211 RepID=A0AAE1FE87_PETCI|nr:hypothetical protein Pcinc_022720 [Petrolisthes cinctipes]
MTSQCTSHDLLVLLKCDNSPHPPIYNLNTLIATTTGGLVLKHVTVPTHVVGRETDWAGRSKYAPRHHTQFFTPTPVCAGFHLGGTFPSRHWCHCQCCSTFSCRQSYRIPILLPAGSQRYLHRYLRHENTQSRPWPAGEGYMVLYCGRRQAPYTGLRLSTLPGSPS